MSSRRDGLLQQMGITQYTLRRPRVLQGEVALTLPAETRLVIVAENPPMLHDPLVADVLRALNLQPSQVKVLTPDRLAMLPDAACCRSWRLGLDAALTLAGSQITSPPLAHLYHDAAAKRALWQQICQSECDLLTQPARARSAPPQ